MNKVDLLAHIARLVQEYAVTHDGRIGRVRWENHENPVILSTSFDCDHKSGELFITTRGEEGQIEYVLSTESIREVQE